MTAKHHAGKDHAGRDACVVGSEVKYFGSQILIHKLLLTAFTTLLVALSAGVPQAQVVAPAPFVEVPFEF
jgi:hypothetical protein